MAVSENSTSRGFRLMPKSEFLQRGLRVVREEQAREQRRRRDAAIDSWMKPVSMPLVEAELRVELIELAEMIVRIADDGSIPMGDAKRSVDRALRSARHDLECLAEMPEDQR